MALVVKNLPANAGSLGQEAPLEEGMATHSSVLARKIPWTDRAWQDMVHRLTKS